MDKDQAETNKKAKPSLTKWQIFKQALSLLSQIQNMKKFAEAADQLEHNMAPVIVAGILAMVIFISLCALGVYLSLSAAGL